MHHIKCVASFFLFFFFSLCCEGEEAVTSTPSMALSPTGAWRLPPASHVPTSVSSAGGMRFKIKSDTTVRSWFHKKDYGCAQTTTKTVARPCEA